MILAGNPYSLRLFVYAENLNAIMVTYHDTDLSVDLTAQALFGAIQVSGELPVSPSQNYKAGDGVKTEELKRLQYSIPEETGIRSEWLQKLTPLH